MVFCEMNHLTEQLVNFVNLSLRVCDKSSEQKKPSRLCLVRIRQFIGNATEILISLLNGLTLFYLNAFLIFFGGIYCKIHAKLRNIKNSVISQ
jgi:hypothetical protein